MAEEIKSPATNVPRVMVFSVFLNGLMAMVMVVVVLFTLQDPETVLAGPTTLLFMNIFLQAIPSTAGAIFMATILFFVTLCGEISFVAATSRMTWAFARDRGLPGWSLISKVSHLD